MDQGSKSKHQHKVVVNVVTIKEEDRPDDCDDGETRMECEVDPSTVLSSEIKSELEDVKEEQSSESKVNANGALQQKCEQRSLNDSSIRIVDEQNESVALSTEVSSNMCFSSNKNSAVPLLGHLELQDSQCEETSESHLSNISEGGENIFCCDICYKSFATHGNLKRHLRIHTGERQYSCYLCNKSFTTLQHLKTHLRMHTGERPYSCDICNKSFTQMAPLKSHKRTHTGERPFSCDVCSKSFSQMGNLKRHQRVHESEHPYTCDICNKSWTELEALETHGCLG